MGRQNLCRAQRLKSTRGLASVGRFLQHGQVVPQPPRYQVDGVSGQPGPVRYCKAGRDKTTIKWAKEKLLVIDAIKRRMSYEIVDNNMGFKSYVATMQV